MTGQRPHLFIAGEPSRPTLRRLCLGLRRRYTRRDRNDRLAIGLDDRVVLSAVQRVGKGISGTAIRTGKPIMLQGAADRAAGQP